MNLRELKKVRSKMIAEQRAIGLEESQLITEKKGIAAKLEGLRKQLKEASHELSLPEYESMMIKEKYLQDHEAKLEHTILGLQAKRSELSVDTALNHKRIFAAAIEQEAAVFREKHLDAFLHLLCLGHLSGGVVFADLVSIVFALNTRETQDRFKKMLTAMREQIQKEGDRDV